MTADIETRAREFDALPAPGGMGASEMARLIGCDRIETLEVREGYLRSRLPVTEGARAGFSAVFSGTFACWVDWVATAVVAAGRPRVEAIDLLERVRTKALSVEFLGNTQGPFVTLETRVDAEQPNTRHVTVTVRDADDRVIAVGHARLGFVPRGEG